MEAVISGPFGIQLVHEGDAIGNKRVAKILPDSIELAEIEPSNAPAVVKNAPASAMPGPAGAEVITGRTASTPPSSAQSVGFVELAGGSRKSIVLSGEGVNLMQEAPATLDSAEQAQAAPGTRSLKMMAEAQPTPPMPGRPRARSAVAPSHPPEAIQSISRREAGVESPTKVSPSTQGGGIPESPSPSPSGASIGFIEKSNGQTLGIVARADGIRLIPEEGAGRVSEGSLALNEVGPLESEDAPLASAADRASPGRSPPGEKAAISNDFNHFAENPEPQARGVPAEVRPWYAGLPGMSDGDQEDASIGLPGLPNREVSPSSAYAPSPPAEPLQQAAPEVSLRAGNPARGIEYVGFVEWADGRRTDILSRNGEIQLIEESRPTTINRLFTPGVPSGFDPQSRVLSPASHGFYGSPLAFMPIAHKSPAALFSIIDQPAVPAILPSGAPSEGRFVAQSQAEPLGLAIGTNPRSSFHPTGLQVSAQSSPTAGAAGLKAAVDETVQINLGSIQTLRQTP